MDTRPTFDTTLDQMRAVAEETRLRLMLALAEGELSVTELTRIVDQSQPRVSRHLKVLADAGLVERSREGAWIFYRMADIGAGGWLARVLSEAAAGATGVIAADRAKLAEIRQERADVAAAYFRDNAGDWDDLRRMHLPEPDIEQAMRRLVGEAPVNHFIDLGTGTGRMLIVFSDLYRQGTGYDVSREMLAIARARLEAEGISHAQVRQGDLFDLPETAQGADLVCLHQVLHFLPDPARGVAIAAGLLKPGGRLIITDFAAHSLELLRERFAHRRLGFAESEVVGWAKANRLTLADSETLSPAPDQQDKLTVKVWLCRKQGKTLARAPQEKETFHA